MSRQGLALLTERGIKPEVVEYLKTPLSEPELRALLRKLGLKPGEILRTGEDVYKEKYKGKTLTDEQCLKALVEDPIIMERPIVVKGERAVVGRPPERVLDIVD